MAPESRLTFGNPGIGAAVKSAVLAATLLLAHAAPAAAQLPPLPPLPLPTPAPTVAPDAYQANDGGGFRNVLPSGTRGRYSLPELAAFLATGATVPHCCDQLPMYDGLEPRGAGIEGRGRPQVLQGRELRRSGRRRRAHLLAAG